MCVDVSGCLSKQEGILPLSHIQPLLYSTKILEADCRDMSKLFDDRSFDFIVDKATTDGMLCSGKNALTTPLYYSEVGRCEYLFFPITTTQKTHT